MSPIICPACGGGSAAPDIAPCGPSCPRCGERIGPPVSRPVRMGLEMQFLAAVSGTLLGAVAAAVLFLLRN